MNSPLRVPVSTAPPVPESRPHAPAAPSVPLLAVLGGSVLVLLALAVLIARAQAVPASQISQTAACPSIATMRQAILSQEQAGQWSVAASTADLALTTPGLCSADRQVLLTSSLQDKLETLFATTISLDNVPYLRNEVARYHALAQRAQAAQVGFPPPLAVARRAYTLGKDLLAVDAYDLADQQGALAPADREDLLQYTQALAALGTTWATQTSGPSRTQGLRLLVTSWYLSTCFHLGQPAAAHVLVSLVGNSVQRWPQPVPSPLLATCPSTQTAAQHATARTEPSHE